MPKLEKILLTLLSVLLVGGVIWMLQGWPSWLRSGTATGPGGQPLNYAQAKAAEDPSNPCKPPAGYTEEAWREHMGHHPDQYKQCLGQ